MLELFDKYFLILVLIQGFIVGFIDSSFFKQERNEMLAKKASMLGKVMMILAVVLYICSRFS